MTLYKKQIRLHFLNFEEISSEKYLYFSAPIKHTIYLRHKNFSKLHCIFFRY